MVGSSRVGLTGVFEDIYHIPSEHHEGYGWEIELSKSFFVRLILEFRNYLGGPVLHFFQFIS